MKNKYEVVVGNVGTMEYTNKKVALGCYNTYVSISNSIGNRASNEPVTLLKNGDILRDHIPPTPDKLTLAIALIKEMGYIIRYLDENAAYSKYWTNDRNENGGEYVPEAVEKGIMS